MAGNSSHRANRWSFLRQWFDGQAAGSTGGPRSHRIEWPRAVPFLLMHAGALLVIPAGFSWTALGIALGLYYFRIFLITGFYHRYFSHRTFKTSRWFQFLAAALACTAGQRGPLWWAGHHRHHHAHSDDPEDFHSPRQRGFFMSHTGWFLTPSGFPTLLRKVPDLARFPELRWLDRFDWVPLAGLALALLAAGEALVRWAPHLKTGGFQLLAWGFFLSTVAVYHTTYTINSLAHRFGRQRFATGDDSRNNWWLALLTFGEGWHNNHHHFPATVRQGFFWWEFDFTWYLLKTLSWTGLIWGMRPLPARVLTLRRLEKGAGTAAA